MMSNYFTKSNPMTKRKQAREQASKKAIEQKFKISRIIYLKVGAPPALTGMF
jgi:hypothetical protein